MHVNKKEAIFPAELSQAGKTAPLLYSNRLRYVAVDVSSLL